MPSEPIKTLETVMRELRESRAHTYASENAGLYRGFDNGQKRAADSLQPVRDALWGLHDEMAAEIKGNTMPIVSDAATLEWKSRLAAILGEREG